jgi:hypothetical protein
LALQQNLMSIDFNRILDMLAQVMF